jgi:NADH-quinone oxidoreductase subunit N
MLVFGISLVYGETGQLIFSEMAKTPMNLTPGLAVGWVLIIAALGFKIGAAPMHTWIPDTYHGAPTPVTAFLSIAPKGAAFAILLRMLFSTIPAYKPEWVWLMIGTAILSMLYGNIVAIAQRNIKRLLAYSGIAHIGYMLVGLAALTTNGIAMVLFYLVAYLFGNMGAFFVVEAVARSENSEEIDAYKGLAQRSPLLALAMLVFLLSLGGIPFVAGFWAKLYIFLAGVEQGLLGLVFVGAVLTVVALYYYLLVARRMYIEAPAHNGSVKVDLPLGAAIAICLAGVIGIGVYPGPWVAAAQRIAQTLFT